MSNIIDQKTAVHYQWGDHCDAWVMLNKPELSVKTEKMPAGTQEQPHFHKEARQFFYILSGTAVFHLKDEQKIVYPTQSIFIEPTIPHFIANESAEELEFMVISQPSADQDRFPVEKDS